MNELLRFLSGPGFLGTRAPLFPDIVIVALVLVVPLLLIGATLARKRRRLLHAWIMGPTFLVLGAVVIVFILWTRSGLAPRSPQLEAAPFYKSFYLPYLTAHILVALTALAFGSVAMLHGIVRARRSEAHGLEMRGGSGRLHRWVGRIAVTLLLVTSLSGGLLYYFRYLYGN